MIYDLLLMVVTAIGGWTFVLVKDAVTHYPTLPFLQIRFGLAFVTLAVAVRRLPSPRELRVRAMIGLTLALGCLAQALGAAVVLAAIVGHEGATLKFESHGEQQQPNP